MIAKDKEIQTAELWISHILRWGVFLCAAVISAGWATSNVHITNWGLLLLICLPIARVFAAGVIFLKDRDFI